MTNTELKLIRLLTPAKTASGHEFYWAEAPQLTIDALYEAVQRMGETRQCVTLILAGWVERGYAVKLDGGRYCLTV